MYTFSVKVKHNKTRHSLVVQVDLYTPIVYKSFILLLYQNVYTIL